jgi:hypothetical protein
MVIHRWVAGHPIKGLSIACLYGYTHLPLCLMVFLSSLLTHNLEVLGRPKAKLGNLLPEFVLKGLGATTRPDPLRSLQGLWPRVGGPRSFPHLTDSRYTRSCPVPMTGSPHLFCLFVFVFCSTGA